MNCQLVLVPGYNDGAELERSITDLLKYENVSCVAAVPVGLTKFREGLTPLKPFDEKTAAQVIDIIDRKGSDSLSRTGSRKVFAADEFCLTAKREIPDADYYEGFPQLENGVGMWALFKEETENALEEAPSKIADSDFTVVCGMASAPLIKSTVDKATAKWHNLVCRVYPIRNDFFGEKITVSGLVTGSDIINQLKGKEIGKKLLIPANMLRFERDMFLDNVTVTELEEELKVEIVITEGDGADFINKLTEGK
jgi:putative radical SAM enzyme (TIGR03279 family)